MTQVSTDTTDFGWLLDTFTTTVPRVRHTVVVSADGLLMAMSQQLERVDADQLSAIVSGISALTRGAARHLHAGGVRQAVVEMDDAFLLTMAVSDGSVLAVVADLGCDVGVIGYEMALLVSRAEQALTPQLIGRLRAGLPLR